MNFLVDKCLKYSAAYKAAAEFGLARSDELASANALVKTALKEIKLDNTEQKIFALLLSVVQEKAPGTVLRVAGGWVRDKLLGKTSHDIDIALNNMSGEAFANIVNDYMKEHGIGGKSGVSVVKANPDQSKHLATAMLNVLGIPIDFVNLRKEDYAESRIPTVTPGTPEEDGDLTINSMFYNINTGEVEDFVGGLEDLKNGIARTPIDPVKTFIDDPLRILRTIRFAAKYNLALAPELIEAAKLPEVQEAFRNKISPERIWKELAGQEEPGPEKPVWKPGFMAGQDPTRAARLLGEVGLRDVLFGLSEEEMKGLGVEQGMTSFDVDQNNPHHDLTVWEHTLSVLEHLAKNETTPQQQAAAEDYLVRNLSALLHDIGKCDICSRQTAPEGHYTYHGHESSSAKIAEYVLKRMKAPNNVVERVKRLVENHMRLHVLPSSASSKSLRKFVKELEDDWKHSVDLAIADAYGKQMAKGDPQVRQKYDDFAAKINSLITEMGGRTVAKAPVTGHDLMQIGFKPGPMMGQALRALQEELLENPTMSKEDALAFIKTLGLN